MPEKKTKKSRVPAVLLCIAAVIALVLLINRRLTVIVFHNLIDPPKKLSSEEWQGGKTYEKVPYSPVSDSDYLDLYVPDGIESPRLMILVHGGGFVYNDSQSRQATLMYHYFRDHGYACATINYRLAQEAKYPAAIEDVKAAVRFLRAHADTYGYSPEGFLIWGESAGGYLATMTAVTNDDEFTDLPFIGQEEAGEQVSARVDTLIDFYGAISLGSMAEVEEEFVSLGIPSFIYRLSNLWLTSALDKMAPEGTTSVETFWLGKEIEDMTEEELRLIDPAFYIHKNLGTEEGQKSLRVFVLHGDADICVPITESEGAVKEFIQALGEENVSFRTIHNAKHAGEAIYSDTVLAQLEGELAEEN